MHRLNPDRRASAKATSRPLLDRRRRLIGSLAVLLAAACFGTLGPVSRLAYDGGIEPLGFVAWRSAIGGFVLAIFLAIRVRRGAERWVPFGSMSRGTIRGLAVVTVAGVLLNLAIFIAYGRVTVALALLGFYTYPVMVALVDGLVRREALGRSTISALGLAIVGMAFVVAGGLGSGGSIRVDALGIGLALFAACAQTVFIAVSRNGYEAVPTLQAMTTILLGDATAFVAIAVLAGGAGQLAGPVAHPATWGLLLIGGVAGAGLASALFLTGVRWIGGVRTGILALFEPVVGVALAAVILAEAIGPLQVLGGLFVLAAALLLQVAGPAQGPGVRTPPEAVPGTI